MAKDCQNNVLWSNGWENSVVLSEKGKYRTYILYVQKCG